MLSLETRAAKRIAWLRRKSVKRIFLSPHQKAILAEAEALLAVEIGNAYLRKIFYSVPLSIVERNKDVAVRYILGETLQTVGERYGLTRERVRQILHRNGIGTKRRNTISVATKQAERRDDVLNQIDHVMAREKARGLPTGVIEISRLKKKRFRASLSGKVIGYYYTAVEAVAARDAEAMKKHVDRRRDLRAAVTKLQQLGNDVPTS